MTTPGERIDEILGALDEALAGKRRLPVIQTEDAALVCDHLHAQVDHATAARADAVAAAGHTIACHAGCARCCHNMPGVFAGEAVTIARWLLSPGHEAALAGFRARHPAWHAALADALDAWSAGVAARDDAAVAEAGRSAWRRQVMCAFNDAGMCTIYDVRPTICRTAHALDRVCEPETADELESFVFEPLDAYVERIRPVMVALHAALGTDLAWRPVCAAVAELVGP